MRKILSVFFFFAPFCVLSQARPILNQYMLHQPTFNPGYVDVTSKFSINTLYRRQWMQQNNFPEIGYVYGHYNFDRTHGAGLLISNDLMNSVNQFEVAANYVYNIPIGNGYNLGMGIKAGFNEQNLINPTLVYFDAVEPTLSSGYTFRHANLGIGASISSKTLDVHLSLPYIFGNSLLNKSKIYSAAYNHLYFSTGYKIRFSDWFIMYPSAIVTAVRGSRVHANVNVNFLSSQLIWYGVGLSSDLAANFSLGVFTQGGLRFTYSYDHSFFSKHFNTGISHEFSISYAKLLDDNPFNKRKAGGRFKSGRRWR